MRRRIPHYESPLPPDQEHATLNSSTETLSDFYQNIIPQFEERVLQLSSTHANNMDNSEAINEGKEQLVETVVPLETANGQEDIIYSTARTHSINVEISDMELHSTIMSYTSDHHFSKVYKSLQQEMKDQIPHERSAYPQYHLDERGLLYFWDWSNNLRLCIGSYKQDVVISNTHDILTEGAHSGYHRTYNRIAAHYYWPRMAKRIRYYVQSCDICQKVKHHVPHFQEVLL